MATNDQITVNVTDRVVLKDAPPHILQQLAVVQLLSISLTPHQYSVIQDMPAYTLRLNKVSQYADNKNPVSQDTNDEEGGRN